MRIVSIKDLAPLMEFTLELNNALFIEESIVDRFQSLNLIFLHPCYGYSASKESEDCQ